MLLLDTDLQGVDLSHAEPYRVYRFNSVNDLVYITAVVDASPYVPTTEQASLALAEYRKWCATYNQPQIEELINLLSTVDANKAALLAEVEKQAAKFESNLNKEMFFTSSLGFKVNGDRRTKDNLQDLITFFDLQAVEGKINYRDYDNNNQSLTKENLQALLAEHVKNGQALYTAKWQLQNQINEAQDLDALHDITVEFTMSDFSAKTKDAIGDLI